MKRFDQKGFTVPEVVVSLVLTGIFCGMILVFAFNFWGYGASTEADLTALVDRINASDFLREYIGSSSGLINQNSIQDNNPEVVDAFTTPAYYWELIHAVPGNTSISGGTSTRPLLYFRRPSLNTSNAFIMNGSIPYEDEFVLYFDRSAKKIRLRTLANSLASGNRLQTSCRDSLASSSCPADRTLIENIESVDLRYFSRSGNLIDYTSSTDSLTGLYNGPDFAAVEVVELTLNVSKRAAFSKVDKTKSGTVIRIALRNS